MYTSGPNMQFGFFNPSAYVGGKRDNLSGHEPYSCRH